MSEQFLTFIGKLADLSPPILLTVAINLILFALKRSPVPDWLLPWLAMSIGAAAYPFLANAAKVSYECRNPVVYNVLQGVAIGGLSVCFNQAFRQWIKRFGGSTGDTDEIKKPDVNGPDL